MGPGAMALTRIPDGPNSTAMTLVMWITGAAAAMIIARVSVATRRRRTDIFSEVPSRIYLLVARATYRPRYTFHHGLQNPLCNVYTRAAWRHGYSDEPGRSPSDRPADPPTRSLPRSPSASPTNRPTTSASTSPGIPSWTAHPSRTHPHRTGRRRLRADVADQPTRPRRHHRAHPHRRRDRTATDGRIIADHPDDDPIAVDALVYRLAYALGGQKPAATIAIARGLSPATGPKRAHHARQAGLIPPAEPGKASGCSSRTTSPHGARSAPPEIKARARRRQHRTTPTLEPQPPARTVCCSHRFAAITGSRGTVRACACLTFGDT